MAIPRGDVYIDGKNMGSGSTAPTTTATAQSSTIKGGAPPPTTTATAAQVIKTPANQSSGGETGWGSTGWNTGGTPTDSTGGSSQVIVPTVNYTPAYSAASSSVAPSTGGYSSMYGTSQVAPAQQQAQSILTGNTPTYSQALSSTNYTPSNLTPIASSAAGTVYSQAGTNKTFVSQDAKTFTETTGNAGGFISPSSPTANASVLNPNLTYSQALSTKSTANQPTDLTSYYANLSKGVNTQTIGGENLNTVIKPTNLFSQLAGKGTQTYPEAMQNIGVKNYSPASFETDKATAFSQNVPSYSAESPSANVSAPVDQYSESNTKAWIEARQAGLKIPYDAKGTGWVDTPRGAGVDVERYLAEQEARAQSQTIRAGTETIKPATPAEPTKVEDYSLNYNPYANMSTKEGYVLQTDDPEQLAKYHAWEVGHAEYLINQNPIAIGDTGRTTTLAAIVANPENYDAETLATVKQNISDIRAYQGEQAVKQVVDVEELKNQNAITAEQKSNIQRVNAIKGDLVKTNYTDLATNALTTGTPGTEGYKIQWTPQQGEFYSETPNEFTLVKDSTGNLVWQAGNTASAYRMLQHAGGEQAKIQEAFNANQDLLRTTLTPESYEEIQKQANEANPEQYWNQAAAIVKPGIDEAALSEARHQRALEFTGGNRIGASVTEYLGGVGQGVVTNVENIAYAPSKYGAKISEALDKETTLQGGFGAVIGNTGEAALSVGTSALSLAGTLTPIGFVTSTGAAIASNVIGSALGQGSSAAYNPYNVGKQTVEMGGFTKVAGAIGGVKALSGTIGNIAKQTVAFGAGGAAASLTSNIIEKKPFDYSAAAESALGTAAFGGAAGIGGAIASKVGKSVKIPAVSSAWNKYGIQQGDYSAMNLGKVVAYSGIGLGAVDTGTKALGWRGEEAQQKAFTAEGLGESFLTGAALGTGLYTAGALQASPLAKVRMGETKVGVKYGEGAPSVIGKTSVQANVYKPFETTPSAGIAGEFTGGIYEGTPISRTRVAGVTYGLEGAEPRFLGQVSTKGLKAKGAYATEFFESGKPAYGKTFEFDLGRTSKGQFRPFGEGEPIYQKGKMQRTETVMEQRPFDNELTKQEYLGSEVGDLLANKNKLTRPKSPIERTIDDELSRYKEKARELEREKTKTRIKPIEIEKAERRIQTRVIEMELTRPFDIEGVRTKELTIIKPIEISRVKAYEITNPDYKVEERVKEPRYEVKEIVEEKTKTKPREDTRTQEKLKTELPGLVLPSFGLGGGESRGTDSYFGAGRQVTKYNPSLAAEIFNIHGGAIDMSGAGIRPILDIPQQRPVAKPRAPMPKLSPRVPQSRTRQIPNIFDGV